MEKGTNSKSIQLYLYVHSLTSDLGPQIYNSFEICMLHYSGGSPDRHRIDDMVALLRQLHSIPLKTALLGNTE